MYELEYRSIISSGDVAMIERYSDVTQQNHFLHARLLKTCTKEALIEVSDIMSAVRGNLKMNALGEDLRCAEGTYCICYVMHECECAVSAWPEVDGSRSSCYISHECLWSGVQTLRKNRCNYLHMCACVVGVCTSALACIMGLVLVAQQSRSGDWWWCSNYRLRWDKVVWKATLSFLAVDAVSVMHTITIVIGLCVVQV